MRLADDSLPARSPLAGRSHCVWSLTAMRASGVHSRASVFRKPSVLPGRVHVEKVSSGGRTIVGAATAASAFPGRAGKPVEFVVIKLQKMAGPIHG